MFERFSDAARRAVVASQEEARGFGHDFIGTEHLLLGLLNSDGAGFRLLQGFEVPFVEVADRVLAIIGRGHESPSGHIAFTPRAKKVLELSLREAIELGDRFIGTEHILLGLLREGQGVGAQILVERSVTHAAVRARLPDIERDRPPDGAESADDLEMPDDDGMIHVPAEHFTRLVAEVARLRDLLRRHGIDPGEQPGFGDEGDPPVA